MKICYIASTIEVPYRDGLGSGGSTHTFEVAKTLVGMGDQVYVLCRRSFAGQGARESLEGIMVDRLFDWNSTTYRILKSRGFLWRTARIPYYFLRSILQAIKILRLARKERFDVIYERSSSSTLAGTGVAWILRIPLVLEINDQSCQSISLRVARKIVTPEKSMIAPAAWKKVIPLEWGVNTRMFHPAIDGDPIRRQYGITKRGVILFLGSGLPWHGLGEIVAAAPMVLRNDCNIAFLIVGGSPEISGWQRIVEERGWSEWFHFTGPVGYPDVPAYVAAADIALAPYNSRLAEQERHRFASPLKVLEYMACGKPVVVTRVANVRQTIEDGLTGLVIPEDSPDALAEAILRLLRKPDLRRALGDRARAVAEEKFSWQRHCTVLRGLFAELTNPSSQGKAKLLSEAKA